MFAASSALLVVSASAALAQVEITPKSSITPTSHVTPWIYQMAIACAVMGVLIVVVIMAILAATIIPQFTDSTKDAKTSTAKMNLATLRAQIQLYRTQHTGQHE